MERRGTENGLLNIAIGVEKISETIVIWVPNGHVWRKWKEGILRCEGG